MLLPAISVACQCSGDKIVSIILNGPSAPGCGVGPVIIAYPHGLDGEVNTLIAPKVDGDEDGEGGEGDREDED